MSEPDSSQNNPSQDGSQQVRMQHVTARVPTSVEGVLSTGMIAMTGNSEFVLDFIQNLGQAPQVVARIVVPHGVMPQFIEALRTNLELYSRNFGTPPELPTNKSDNPPSAQQIYDELKLPDEMLSGVYANGVMIVHTAAEFKLDFLTNLFPHSAVSARIYLAAPQIPRLIQSLSGTYQQFQKRVAQQQQKKKDDQGDEPPEPTSEI